MHVEAFEKEFKTYCFSEKSEPELPKYLCLVDLYCKIIKDVINNFKTKAKIAEKLHSDLFLYDISINKNHQNLALGVLFNEV